MALLRRPSAPLGTPCSHAVRDFVIGKARHAGIGMGRNLIALIFFPRCARDKRLEKHRASRCDGINNAGPDTRAMWEPFPFHHSLSIESSKPSSPPIPPPRFTAIARRILANP